MRFGVRVLLAALAVPVLALGPAVTTAATDASVASAASCVVDDATITWGFKESFRSYLSGSIANGQWSVSQGAEYQTPEFRFVNGAGSLDRNAMAGAIQFPGAITFTGHGDILNTTVENPVVEFRGDRAALLFDIRGTTQDGAEVDEGAVEFVTLALDEGDPIESTDDLLTIRDIPATLTDAGAQAFGTYQSGEPFDPLTLEIEFSRECEAPASDASWVPWAIGGTLLVVGVVIAFAFSRRGATATAPPLE